MSAIVFDGKKLASEKEKELTIRVKKLKAKGIIPCLVSILIGENPSSVLYLHLKQKAARRIGVKFEIKQFPQTIDDSEVVDLIQQKNSDPMIHGIMVQLPLPKKSPIANYQLLITGAISPRKDIDCLTDENFRLLEKGKPRFLPATVKAIISILNNDLRFMNYEEKKICVVGASGMVGRPLVAHLKSLGSNVLVVDEFTGDIGRFTSRADILISAAGVAGLIKKEMVKPGAMVIDVGSPRGDVDFEEVKKVASFITPVPGGVGPLTVICLMENLIKAINKV